MTKRLSFLLLDANIVIELFEQGLWDKVVASCDIHLARTVIGEAHFFERDGERSPIDLRSDLQAGRIKVFDVAASDVAAFRRNFDMTYMDRLDPGETESLAYLVDASLQHRLCSADGIVYKVLGNLDRSDQGISLEEVLGQLGLGRRLARQFTRAFRDQYTREGVKDGLWGRGERPSKRDR